ncbi:MAG: hypothetical protein IJD71_05075 [Clostridia bacterium]|nr:hypothetical protein [Clostridia bacterium]MBQ7107974.1 hypothetical protein [Clostridia bacterium]
MKVDIVNKLIQYFPNLKKDIEEHLADFHEIYLHLIFGDIFNPYLLNLLDAPQDNRLELIKASELVEYMSKSDISIQEVVVTTVLERLLDDREKLTLFSEIAGEQTCQFIENLK